MRQKKQTQRLRNEFPADVFLSTEKGYFYVVSPTKRYRFTTKRVLDSWSPQRIIDASEDEPGVKKLRIVSKMKFRNGSLLFSQSTGKMYLISGKKLRHITNPDVLDNLSLRRQDAVWVSKEEINLHEMGEPLN